MNGLPATLRGPIADASAVSTRWVMSAVGATLLLAAALQPAQAQTQTPTRNVDLSAAVALSASTESGSAWLAERAAGALAAPLAIVAGTESGSDWLAARKGSTAAVAVARADTVAAASPRR
jgi:hypothetical protein